MAEHELRTDPYLGTAVHVVRSRQGRPNLPASGCPFCPGGLEAPEDYVTRSFPNRWPAMPGDRCEVVLYTPDHDASLATLGPPGVRRVVDLWAERTSALGARADVDYVLCFENRGAEVGATISHPHGQIYAYDRVPRRLRALLEAGWRPDPDPGPRLVAGHGAWSAVVPWAPTFPVSVVLSPATPVPDLVALDDAGRADLAVLLADVLGRLDALYGTPLPYMMWVHQRPTGGGDWPGAWMHLEVVSPWRAAGVPRFIAAAEVAGEEYFVPVAPEELAERLRAARSGPS